MGEALARHPQKGVDSQSFCKVHQNLAASENILGVTKYEVPRFQAWDPFQQYSDGDNAFTCHDLDDESAFNTDVTSQEFFGLHKVSQGTVHGVTGRVGLELNVA